MGRCRGEVKEISPARFVAFHAHCNPVYKKLVDDHLTPVDRPQQANLTRALASLMIRGDFRVRDTVLAYSLEIQAAAIENEKPQARNVFRECLENPISQPARLLSSCISPA